MQTLESANYILPDMALHALIRGMNVASVYPDNPHDQHGTEIGDIAEFYEVSCRELIRDQHARNIRAGWWHAKEDIHRTGPKLERNFGELLMLMVSEIGEIPHRHTLSTMDDKLPHRLMFEVELADFLIRLWDTCGAYYEIEFPKAFARATQSSGIRISLETPLSGHFMGIVRALSAALEGRRKNKPADEIVPMFADAMVCAFRIGKVHGLDVAGACIEKIAFNATRADHKPENRIKEGGKSF